MSVPHWQAVKPPPVQHILRKHPRYLLSVPLNVYEVSGKGLPLAHGLTLDLSLGGIAAVLCGSVHSGQTCELEVHLPNGCFRTRAIARHANGCRCGFEFLSSDPAFELGVSDAVLKLSR